MHPSWPWIAISGNNDSFYLPGTGRVCKHWFILCFHGIKEGQSVLIVLAISRITLIQNNQHARVAYLGVAYTAPLHFHNVVLIVLRYGTSIICI